MRRIFFKLLYLSPVWLIIASVCYYADPNSLFHGEHYARVVANYLLAGRNVANLSNYSDRVVQKHFIGQLHQAPQVVIFGSSRSMPISTALLSTNPEFAQRLNASASHPMFNHSVSAASLRDLIAIYQLYREDNLQPDVVLLSLDAWILDGDARFIAWKTLGDEYYRALDEWGMAPTGYIWLARFDHELVRYGELFSPAYFQQARKVLVFRWQHPFSQTTSYPTDATTASDSLKRSDGSRAKVGVQPTLEESRLRALDYLSSLRQFRFVELDAELMQQFERLIQAIQTEGSEVVFLLPPYHPLVYTQISHLAPPIIEAQQYFETIAQRLKIPVLGSYNPADVDCQAQDFSDGIHALESCFLKIFGRPFKMPAHST